MNDLEDIRREQEKLREERAALQREREKLAAARAAREVSENACAAQTRPKNALRQLLGSTVSLQSHSGQTRGIEAVDDKVVAFYFSAHWCPPCRSFTPQLSQWYSQSLKAKGLEVIFVSADRDESSFMSYFREMPWLALKYSDSNSRERLNRQFAVSGIPSLVIVDVDGTLITKDGRSVVVNDPTGRNFPWRPSTRESRSSQEGSSPQPEGEITNGSKVRIQNIQSAPDLNGQVATVVRFDPSKERYIVSLNGSERSIRRENLAVLRLKSSKAEGTAYLKEKLAEVQHAIISGGARLQVWLSNYERWQILLGICLLVAFTYFYVYPALFASAPRRGGPGSRASRTRAGWQDRQTSGSGHDGMDLSWTKYSDRVDLPMSAKWRSTMKEKLASIDTSRLSPEQQRQHSKLWAQLQNDPGSNAYEDSYHQHRDWQQQPGASDDYYYQDSYYYNRGSFSSFIDSIPGNYKSMFVLAVIGYLCWKDIIPVSRMGWFELMMLWQMLEPWLHGLQGGRRRGGFGIR